MRLNQYRELKRISRKQAAEAIGVTAEAIRRYELEPGAADRQIPREDIMARIIAWSDGQVLPNDFYDLGESGAAEAAEAQPEAVNYETVLGIGDGERRPVAPVRSLTVIVGGGHRHAAQNPEGERA